MDFGRQMVLLFTRLFEVHFLAIILTKQFVSSKDVSDALHFAKRNTHLINLDLSSLFPGWKYYRVDHSVYSGGGASVYKNNILQQKINCTQTKRVCIDTLKVIDAYVYMKGKFCIKVYRPCHNRNNHVRVIKGTSKLFLPMPWTSRSVDISNIYPRFYKPINIHCMNVNNPAIFIASNGTLVIDKKFLRTQIPYAVKCLIQGRDDFIYKNSVLNRTLEILFEPITLNLKSRNRRSAASAQQKRSISRVFQNGLYSIDVKENVPIGHVIIQLNASGGNLNYLFSKNDDDKTDKYFKVNQTTGEVTIKQELDREAGTTQFTIDVTATDKKNNLKFGTATVVISIIDVNDNKPVFVKSVYKKSIKEEQPVGRFILTVQATDRDEGINKLIRYSIVKNKSRCPFKIDKYTGVITNRQVLDREERSSYSLHVQAEDQGIDPGPLSSVAIVNLTVEDVNDNKPIFARKQYFISLPEDTKVDTIILNITATDQDAGTNGIVEYQPLGLSEFSIDSNTGKVKLRRTLDYDMYRGEYEFTVVVFDRGSPPEHANVPVKITVTDVNDNPPRFTRPSKASRPIEILEDKAIGSVIYKLSARDKDSGSNGRITYKFADAEVEKKLPFAINPRSGKVTVTRLLDYEKEKRYQFFVVAEDNGNPPKFAKASLGIAIVNVNDNAPRFENSTYKVNISEDTRIGSNILTVSAVDPDDLDTDFTYSIVRDHSQKACFQIDQYSGVIFFRNCKFDYKKQKQYRLRIKVTDIDEKFGFANVIINIYDANNNAPRFDKTVTFLNVKEDVPIGSSIGKVTAKDDDSGENARIIYSLERPDNVFRLNTSSGELRTKQRLDREEKESYRLVVIAQDHGKPYPKHGKTTVIIRVQDVNDNAPVFEKKLYSFTFKEDVGIGYMVGSVLAHDKDDEMNKDIRYSLSPTKDGDGCFTIDIVSGMISTKKLLDREKKSKYDLIVLATDQALSERKSSTAKLVIELEDVQDSPPVFHQHLYTFTIEENTNVIVGRVGASLADQSFQHTLRYSISKNVLHLFNIDLLRGVIQVTQPLDYEEQHQYELKIRVSVSSGKTDTATVIVNVTDVNDHPPVLEDFYIFLNVINGTFDPKFKVPATDKDVTSILKYRITSENKYNFVELNEATGDIYLQKSIVNSASEIKIEFEVQDGKFTTTAYGRIAVSELTKEMVENSIFIILNDTTRDVFLDASILKKFRSSLAQTFNCDSGRIFIVSIEESHDYKELYKTDAKVPMLEVVVAVRLASDDMFFSAKTLKDHLYLNSNNFTRKLGIEVVSFDLWNEYWCSAESCDNFQECAIVSKNTKRRGKTISSQYVTFRGVSVQQALSCTCPSGFRNGPDSECSESYSLCYSRPCGDHGKCIATDGGFTCSCEQGYSGKYCNIDKRLSTCPGTTPFSLRDNPCGLHGKCENSNAKKGGFSCMCRSDVDRPMCTLSTRSFKKSTYIALKGLSQRWNLDLEFEFTTEDSNAVLMYNGRYNNLNDFMAVEIVDGQVIFSLSIGKYKGKMEKVFTVKSFVPGGVNNGKWHKVKLLYNVKHIDIAVGQHCDISTAPLLNGEGKHEYCSASIPIRWTMKSLDLSGPLLVGGLPNLNSKFRSRSKDFVGCIRNIKIDHKQIDLLRPMVNYLSTGKCPEKREKVSMCATKNPCKNGNCVDSFKEPLCICTEGFIGRFCETDSRRASPVITLIKGSEIVIDKFNITHRSKMLASIVLKTTKKNAVIWQEEIDSKIGYLKITNGYVSYVFDSTAVVNLSSLYISNGKWHEIKVLWKADKLFLSAEYGKYIVVNHFTIVNQLLQLTHVGGRGDSSLIGCLQGFSYGGDVISLKTMRSNFVFAGCSQSNICNEEDPCGKHGKCISLLGSPECKCEAEYQGPQCTDICATNPCKNGGRCINKKSGFDCQCLNNFTGNYCETETKATCKEGYYGEPGSGLCGPCTCKVKENYDRVCDKDGNNEKDSFPGKCFCRDTFYNSAGTCMPCSCLKEGSSSQTCDKLSGKCSCLPGVVGRKCDQCPGAWQELTSQCQEINTSCPKSYTEGIWWNRVAPGATRVENCPRGAFGNATRYCHFRKSWSPPNLFGCVSIGFHNVKQSSKQLMRGNAVLTPNWAKQLANQLEYAVNTSQRLYGKDIEIGYTTLQVLVDYEANHTDGSNLVSSEDPRFVLNLVAAASNLISLSVKEFWDSIQKRGAGTAGLMKQMEKFVAILSKNFAFVKRRRIRRSIQTLTLTPYSEATENIYLEIQPISLQSGEMFTFPQHLQWWAKKYPVWLKPTIAVSLTHKFFGDNKVGKVMNVGLVIYKTLGKLLPQELDVEDRENGKWYAVDVISDVFSLTIPGVKQLSSQEKVKIVYKDIPKNISSVKLVCAFWNYSLSGTISGGWSQNGCTGVSDNSSDVTCYCSHLTSFALVAIRYTEVIPRIYQIDMLTYIGIGVSMMLLMVGFLVFFCLGQLKSNANSIHKNLALVAFLAELVFAAAVNRPEIGENSCRIVAIIIHYFVTCTFCWLLVEALHMYRMILEPRDINYGQMMFYYFIGWGAPVMVVGVTAGLRPEGYGNNEFCWVSIKASKEITWTYLAPIMAVIAGNIFLVFVAIIASCEKQHSRKAKKKNVSAIRYRLAISLVFLPLLGATVVAGLVVVSYDHQLFMYLFPVFCVLEGLYLIFFYVIFNRKVRREAKNAYMRWKSGDKTYGIKTTQRRPMKLGVQAYGDDRHGLRPILQTFNIGTSSTSDSSDADVQRRRARILVAGSETTDFPTTTCNDSSDSSEEDSDVPRRRRRDYDSESDSSDDNSSGDQAEQEKLANGIVPTTSTQWKQATQKKLVTKRTYASDGPMHSTPSDTSSDKKKSSNKAGFTPTKLNMTEVTVVGQSESDEEHENEDAALVNGEHVVNGISAAMMQRENSSNTESDSSKKDKGPVSILKKKSQYDVQNGRNRYVRVKDHTTTRKPLIAMEEATEMNDSQV